MNRMLVAEELVKVAGDLAALEEPKVAALGRKDFEALVSIMKSTGVSKNKQFVSGIVSWLESQNPSFDEDRFLDALK